MVYPYVCDAPECGRRGREVLEVREVAARDEPLACGECSGPMRRKFTAPQFILTFQYQTDKWRLSPEEVRQMRTIGDNKAAADWSSLDATDEAMLAEAKGRVAV